MFSFSWKDICIHLVTKFVSSHFQNERISKGERIHFRKRIDIIWYCNISVKDDSFCQKFLSKCRTIDFAKTKRNKLGSTWYMWPFHELNRRQKSDATFYGISKQPYLFINIMKINQTKYLVSTLIPWCNVFLIFHVLIFNYSKFEINIYSSSREMVNHFCLKFHFCWVLVIKN